MTNGNWHNRRSRGQAMIIAVIFLLFLSTTVVVGIATPILKQARNSLETQNSKRSLILAQSAFEDVYYRLVTGKQALSEEVLTLYGHAATTTVTNIADGKRIVTTGSVNRDIRKLQVDIRLGNGISFRYGMQAGQGGFTMSNSSSIIGNVFSAGPVVGAGNMIYGDVVSAGPSGSIRGIHATGTARAHSIGASGQATIIDKDAYYQTKTNTTVGGVSYPGSADQAFVAMPISDEQIAEWEAIAEAGGSVTCTGGTYTITTSMNLGPKKIPCNLVLSGSPTVTVTGHIWVTGNITIQNSSVVRMSAILGNQNVAIIADNPTNRLTSSRVTIANSASFYDSGTAGSFVFLISQNNSAENGGSTAAITLANNTKSLVAYAPHGLIPLANSVSLKEVTAYKITLANSASVVYDTGLPSTLFDTGPAGGYEILSWQEIQ